MVSANHDRKAFLSLLEPELVRDLETRRDSACGLWPDLRIAYVNPAWARFGARNGGGAETRQRWSEGGAFLAGVGSPLRTYYDTHLRKVLESGEPWDSEYECSSPELYRLFRMQVRAVGSGRGLLVLHTRLVQRSHEPGVTGPGGPDPAPYVDENGLLQQCVHCRRVRRRGDGEVWDWVPAWVEHVPDHASGSLCPQCLATRYPDLARSA